MSNNVQKSGRRAARAADRDSTSTTDAPSIEHTKRRDVKEARSGLTVKDAKRQAAEKQRDARRLAAETKQNESDDRFTAPEFIQAVEESFGKINFDPCWHEASAVRPERYLDVRQGHNGLRMDWSGPLAFVNPPWSAQDKWVKRAHDEWRKGNVRTVLCLVPAAISTAFFHSTLAKDANVFLIDGRPRFFKKDSTSEATMNNTMVIALGASDRQRAHFAKLVRGAWWVPEDLLSVCAETTRVNTWSGVAYLSTTSCSAPYFDSSRIIQCRPTSSRA